MQKHVLIIPDGAADHNRERGGSPLEVADTPNMDFVAREGVSGLMQTLYEDLPKESMVAQMGMLGWDPRLYYPNGRASCELRVLNGIELNQDDIAFRANLVRMDGYRLASYNADYITTADGAALVNKINSALQEDFPEYELYHNSDFRTTLIVRRAGIEPQLLKCLEPHESEGMEFVLTDLIQGSDATAADLAVRINFYIAAVADILRNEQANALFPWSASRKFALPSFREVSKFQGQVGIVGNMDFLHGIALAGSIDFFKTGNGRPDTDYECKGRKAVSLLAADYELVICHINGPDEASHMGDLALKIQTLEQIDRFIVRPIVDYFIQQPDDLGGVMIVPDHYSNTYAKNSAAKRSAVHSLEPVPFVLWNGCEKDSTICFGESEALAGKYAAIPLSHLSLLEILDRTRHLKSDRQAVETY